MVRGTLALGHLIQELVKNSCDTADASGGVVGVEKGQWEKRTYIHRLGLARLENLLYHGVLVRSPELSLDCLIRGSSVATLRSLSIRSVSDQRTFLAVWDGKSCRKAGYLAGRCKRVQKLTVR